MTTFQQVRAIERDDEALRTASIINIEGAAVPEIRILPAPIVGRLSSAEGAAQVNHDYDGRWWF